MRYSTLLVVVFAATANASWFHDDPVAPSAWTADQYQRAQTVFANIKESAFDTWDESKLREFLLEQGVVDPSGPREQLALLAKQKYAQYSSAASSYSASASTAVYGDSNYQASKSVSSFIAQATEDIARKVDDSRDYVYSTWDDNQLRTYLEDKGVIKAQQQTTRDELLTKMRDAYVKNTNPVWQAWSDSYIHEWLTDHGVLKSDAKKTRDSLSEQMKQYYYDTHGKEWDSWTDSQMKDWLVEHNVIKKNAQIQREKMQKLIADNYINAKDTVWAGWRDSDMRSWLIEHGYMRSDSAEKTRDELVALMHDKYTDNSVRAAPYLVWPDARLRAYLRENGLSEAALPSSRPGLLQEARIRYVQAETRAEKLYTKIREVLHGAVESAEDKLGMILEILTGHDSEAAKAKAYQSYKQAQEFAGEKGREGSEFAGKKYEEGKDWANEKFADEREYLGKKKAEASKVEL